MKHRASSSDAGKIRATLLFGLALALAVGAAVPVYLASRPSPDDRFAATPKGYYVLLPIRPGAAEQRRVVIDAKTNLPDGMLISITLSFGDEDAYLDSHVVNGGIPIRVENDHCHWFQGQLEGSTVRVRAQTLGPHFYPVHSVPAIGPAIGGRSAVPAAYQTGPTADPKSVRAELGDRYERLIGPQARFTDVGRILEANAFYRFPATSCTGWISYSDAGPVVRPTSDRPPAAPAGHPDADFPWCPDVAAALPTETATWDKAEMVAMRFDWALANHRADLLRKLADPLVRTYGLPFNATAEGTPYPIRSQPVAKAAKRWAGPCGPDVALRTLLVELSNAVQPDGVFYLVLRPGGWRVWMEQLCTTTRMSPCMDG